MPICEITAARGHLTARQKQKVAERLTEILLEAEGFPDNPVSRSLCHVSFAEPESVYLGGRQSEQGKIIVKIHVFADAYSQEAKAKVFRNVTWAFVEEDDFTRSQQGSNVWCLIFPAEKDNFGVAGAAVTLEQVRRMVAGREEVPEEVPET
jgi:phenylpyruvate tautomerase PptA (4-oxalocrotonate tautomerase family)